MTIRIPILTGLLFSLFILTSWVQLDKSKNVFVSISATTSGVMQKGYGIIMTLINIDTKMSFKTKSLGGMSPHSIIEDLPPGKYIVSKIEIPLGGFKYINQSQQMTSFFGVLEFEEGKNYYFGDFYGYREVGRQNVFHLWIDNEKIPEKFLVKLKKKGINLTEKDFIKTYPYSKDTLMVY
ncbi:MAG TPA: hypothetical protein PK649_09650 [Vicingus sp.]|jgi:hypothetical protein|nr:hypothetical protein [Flavobacteriales bacterium]HRN42321.1 hypothetical protein [Vicingus sp.]HRP60258.1 hypothetical protein [Vicingus sp.]